MGRPLLFCILLIAAFCQVSLAQVPASPNKTYNLRQQTFRVSADSIRLDTLSIIPNTLTVAGIAKTDYRLDEVKAILYWKIKPVADSVTITYRVFPFRLNASVQHLYYDSVKTKFYVRPFEFNAGLPTSERSIFDFGSLNVQGNFERQIGFGNRQDAVLTSAFNMQLNGILGDSIEIQAAITDNNIPIQPDGNTQQLNEFDQVYLQFKKKGWQLNLGDIDLRQNQSYFLNFYKRLQGISFQTNNRLSSSVNSKTLVSGSVAKGKFTRNILTPLEGNQGPYRLRGANNEFFFIVLANTERVFYDGQLLQRGEDQDYVINYNTAEITFTPKRMITKDSRIQVEFEYADRNYLNANLYFSQEFGINKKLTLRFGAFQNGDAKNSQINQTLDDKQKLFLSQVGDSIQKAFYPSAVIDTFAAGKILYQKIYVGTDSFYKYSTDPALAKYSLSFVDVGQGNGDYVPDFNGANGKVYLYVPPVGIVKQGRYAPVQILVTPKRQQIVNLGADYKIGANTLLKAEVATSNNDVNTFSEKDNGDDRGWAAKMQLNNDHFFPGAGKLQLTTGIDYEYVQRKFRPLERLRNVEFTRDWGLDIQAVPVPVDENIVRATAKLRDNKSHTAGVQFTYYNRSDNYSGFQNVITHMANWKGWLVNNQFMITKFDASATKGSYLRPVIDISKELSGLGKWRLGFNYALEKNSNKGKVTDTLSPTAFWFDIYSAYLQSNDARKNKYKLSFFTRSDKYPVSKQFIRGDRSLNLNLQTSLLSNPNRQLNLNTTFRKLKVYDTLVSKQKDDETILGRVEYVMNEWKGLLTGSVLYEVGAGQEQRRDFAYLEVPAGTGEYAWIDYNSDGVQQLNEFEVARFPDQAKFIRIFTPTNEFIKANYITFNYNLTISPKAMLNKPDLKGFKKLLSRSLIITSLQTSKKSIASGNFEFNPFHYGINNAALISQYTTLLNTFAFNRFNSSKWSFDLSNLRINTKSLLTYGYESRRQIDWTLKWRWNISRSIGLAMSGKTGVNALYTPQFANRNYELTTYSAEPVITFLKGTAFKITAGYKFDQRKNLPFYGGEKSLSNALNLESRYTILQSTSISGKFTFNNISYNYPANTTVSYIMLDGLLPGKNYLWNITLSKQLINNLQLTFHYDGRKAGTSKTVHIGGAELKAFF